MSGSAAAQYRCGPLEIRMQGTECAEFQRAGLTLNIYTAAWEDCPGHCRVDLWPGDPHPGMVAGNWLRTGRTHVDAVPNGILATCLSGLHGRYDRSGARWSITLPPGPIDIWRLTDVEHLMSLVLTTGWRELGWVPLHAGTAVRDGACALLCAPSGGGKTTFTTALLRRGWDSLGDDKLLLRSAAHAPPELRALVHSLNLFPHSVRWFPELAGIEDQPAYSVWTDKRRVPMNTIRAGSALDGATPTHTVRVARRPGSRGIRITTLSPHETLDLLLRQTVIPEDRALARAILGTIARTASSSRGLAVEIGDDAYNDPSHLDAFEEAVLA